MLYSKDKLLASMIQLNKDTAQCLTSFKFNGCFPNQRQTNKKLVKQKNAIILCLWLFPATHDNSQETSAYWTSCRWIECSKAHICQCVCVWVCVWYARLINTSLHVRAALQNSSVGSTHVDTHGLHSYWGDCGDQSCPLLFSIYREQNACNSQLLCNTPGMNIRAGASGSLSHSITWRKECMLTMSLTNDSWTSCEKNRWHWVKMFSPFTSIQSFFLWRFLDTSI